MKNAEKMKDERKVFSTRTIFKSKYLHSLAKLVTAAEIKPEACASMLFNALAMSYCRLTYRTRKRHLENAFVEM